MQEGCFIFPISTILMNTRLWNSRTNARKANIRTPNYEHFLTHCFTRMRHINRCNGRSIVNYLGTAANAKGKRIIVLLSLSLIVRGKERSWLKVYHICHYCVVWKDCGLCSLSLSVLDYLPSNAVWPLHLIPFSLPSASHLIKSHR